MQRPRPVGSTDGGIGGSDQRYRLDTVRLRLVDYEPEVDPSPFSVAVVRIREPEFREEKSFVKFLEAAVERSGTPQTFAAEGLARYPLHRNYFVAKQRV